VTTDEVRRTGVWSGSRETTEHVGEVIGRAARPGDVLAVWGELGSGKTTFVRGLARGLGIDEREVTSPTFVIVHEHEGGRLPLFHIDLYRLAPGDAPSTGWEEALTSGGVTAIEWPDRVERWLPEDRLDVHLTTKAESERHLQFEPTGPRSTRLRDEALPG
jgi:tRNA threonylcarbamoyladenosine biosynthesis protein TsaE